MLLIRLNDLRHEVGDFPRGIELTGTLTRLAGECSDQILVCVPKKIVRNMSTVKLAAGEVVLEVNQLVARQFVGPVEINLAGENAIELRRVGSFDSEHGIV